MRVTGLPGRPIPDLNIKACARGDEECTAPIDICNTGATGTSTLNVPLGFDGYLQITGGSVFPTRRFVNPTVPDTSEPIDTVAFTRAKSA